MGTIMTLSHLQYPRPGRQLARRERDGGLVALEVKEHGPGRPGLLGCGLVGGHLSVREVVQVGLVDAAARRRE